MRMWEIYQGVRICRIGFLQFYYVPVIFYVYLMMASLKYSRIHTGSAPVRVLMSVADTGWFENLLYKGTYPWFLVYLPKVSVWELFSWHSPLKQQNIAYGSHATIISQAITLTLRMCHGCIFIQHIKWL